MQYGDFLLPVLQGSVGGWFQQSKSDRVLGREGRARVYQPSSSLSAELDQDVRWQLLQRILKSPQFLKSVRLREFLTYVTVETLQGAPERVSEQQIGCRVFERQPGYSSSDDNIVRVHARQLRTRLEEYFLADGRDEPLVLEIPKGSYVPVFHPRAVIAPIAPVAVTPGWNPWWIAVGLLSLVCILLGVQNYSLRQGSGDSAGNPTPWMLAAVFDAVEPTTVVIPDSGFGALRAKIGNRPPLVDYSEPGYPRGLLQPGMSASDDYWIRAMTSRPYTTFTNLVVATQLAQLAERNHYKVSFRFAREMNSRDFAEGRFILIGSSIVTPWVSLFESQQSFPSDWDSASSRSIFRNVTPQPGEPEIYMPNAPNAVPGEAFGSVCLLVQRKLASRGGITVLMMEGNNIESSEAAARFTFDAKMSQDALRKANGSLPSTGVTQYRFETMLRTRAVSGASRDSEVVATRFSASK